MSGRRLGTTHIKIRGSNMPLIYKVAEKNPLREKASSPTKTEFLQTAKKKIESPF